jgi:hypothetical protein
LKVVVSLCENGRSAELPMNSAGRATVTATRTPMMNSSQASSRERLQQAIDVEITSLEELESIRALRLRRNALSPISSLPPEVLAAIFSLLCPPSPDRNPGHDHHLSRLHVSHVCHRWREIALNHPSLWSHVDFTDFRASLAGTTEILARAKSVPLYLEARVPDRYHHWEDVRYTTFRQEVQTRIPNVRHLSISAGIFYLHKTLEEFVSSAPILESLSLLSSGGYRNRRTGDHLVIPATLFNGSAPRLSRLELHNCAISWKSPLLKGLKYLEMLSPPAKARPNLTAWLDALDEMPQLKSLALHSFSPIAPPFPFDIKRVATLPSLTHLEIFSPSGDCALVLAHLDLPSLAILSVTVYFHHPNSDDMQVLLPYVAQHAYGPQDTQSLQSVLIFDDGNQAYILAWSIPDINVRVQDLSTFATLAPPTRVSLSFPSGGSRFKDTIRLEIIDAALAALPLDGLITLIVEYFTTFPKKQFWLRHALRWPLLRHIQLAASVLHGFTEMLLDDNGEREGPLLPSLTELVLVGNLSEDWASALMKRVEQGVPLELLDLRLCTPHSSVALRLPSDIAVKILGPENTSETKEMKFTLAWGLRGVARGAVREEVNITSEYYLYTENNDFAYDQDGSGSDSHDEDEDDEA